MWDFLKNNFLQNVQTFINIIIRSTEVQSALKIEKLCSNKCGFKCFVQLHQWPKLTWF